MGCTSSLNQLSSIGTSSIVRNLTDKNKQIVGEAIENDDLTTLALMMQQLQAHPNSQISDIKMSWMLTHLCCRWDSDACLVFLLRHYFAQNPKGYINFVNTQTAEGYTCLHLCCIWDSWKCFRSLHNFGGLSLEIKDNKLKNPYEMAVQYKSTRIINVLKQYKQLSIHFIGIQIEKLLQGPLITLESNTYNQLNIQQEIVVDKSFLNEQPQLAEVIEAYKKIQNEKAKTQKQLQGLLEQKLKKQLDHDIKRNLILLLCNVQQLQKLQFEKSEKQKLKNNLQKQQKVIGALIQAKQEALKHTNQLLKKMQNQKTARIINEVQLKIEQLISQFHSDLAHKLKQKIQILNLIKTKKNSVKIRQTKNFSASFHDENQMQRLKQCTQEIIKLYEEAKAVGFFVDKQFPAENSSIGDVSKSKYSLYTANTIWLRPFQIFRSQFKLFDGIDPDDIKQGSLGVCYMLATVSALAVNPKNIKKIFIFHDSNLGFYVLKLYVNGMPKLFVIDDLIPCCRTTKSPLFTQPIGKQIWVLLLQKAWAKLMGSYLSAQSMTADHMMQDLSGAPGYGWWLSKQNQKTPTQKIKQIVQHCEHGHVVVVTSVADKKIEGIVNNHAYSMLKVFQYNNRYIFKMRNPWGRFQWNGEFGHSSTLCTEDFKNKVGYQDKDDGIFFISQNQLMKAFCFYSISHIKSDYNYSFISFTSKNKQDVFFKIILKQPGDVNIRITQPFDRMVNDKNYKYSPMIFQIGKIVENNKVSFICEGHHKTYFGAKTVHASQDIFQQLEEGQYFIRIRMLWVQEKKYNSAVLGCYASLPVEIQQIQHSKGIILLASLYLSFAEASKKNRAGNGLYRICTMKGQFVFIAQTQEEDVFRVSFKFVKQRMIKTETDMGKISSTELEVITTKGSPGVASAMRLQPSQGGTTGPVSITFTKN